MEPIIEIKNLSKKYNITRQQGGYIALRDILADVAKHPFKFLKNKTKQIVNKEKKEEFWALKDINFTVEKGEAIGIIGANGAGKSTLLKILSKITPPTTGQIEYKGKMSSLLEVGTGFHPELTGRENIFLNGAILGMSKKEIAEKFDDIVEFSGIGKFLDTPVKRYSSGMYVRLAFAVAAHMEPDILVVDEVLAVGDAEFQKKCLGKMDEVTKEAGRTILFVSHNMSAIQNLCKRCILLEGGKIKMIGETKEVIKKYLDRREVSSEIPLADRLDRKGTGNIKFTDIKVTNDEGSEKILSGDKLKIVLKYTSNFPEDIENIKIMLTLRNQSNIPVLRLDNLVTKNGFVKLKPNGEIICETGEINLIGGLYGINIVFIKDNEWQDFVSEAIMLRIINNNEKYNYKINPDNDFSVLNVNYHLKSK